MDTVIACAGSRSGPLEQRREDLDDRPERSRCEVRDLHGRPLRRGVLEHARPAEVVEVVSRAGSVRAVRAEAGDRAVDGRAGNVVGPDAESRGHPGPEALEHDVGAGAERAARSAGSVFRSQTTDSVPPRKAASHAGAVSRIGSPSGPSTRTTRAPSRSSSRLAYAPGR